MLERSIRHAWKAKLASDTEPLRGNAPQRRLRNTPLQQPSRWTPPSSDEPVEALLRDHDPPAGILN